MVSNKSGPLLLMIIIMLFFPALYSLGISVIALELFIIILSCVYILQHKTIKLNEVCAFIVILTCIDKINDLIYCFTLTNIGPVIYVFFVSLVFNNIDNVQKPYVIKIFARLLVLATVLNIAQCAIQGASPLRSLDRDVSAMLMLYSMLNFYYGKRKWIIMALSIFTCVFVLEARTMILSYGVFGVGYYLLRKGENVTLKKTALILEFLFSFFIIFLGIQSEFLLGLNHGDGGIDFSGRGYIWGAALSELFAGSWRDILFGIPSSPENLKAIFDYNLFEYESLNESIGPLLTAGHFHNTVVYYLFNTGIIGTVLLFIICYKSLKRFEFCFENFNIFNALFLVALFNGKSITSMYIISTLFMFILFVKLPKRITN